MAQCPGRLSQRTWQDSWLSYSEATTQVSLLLLKPNSILPLVNCCWCGEPIDGWGLAVMNSPAHFTCILVLMMAIYTSITLLLLPFGLSHPSKNFQCRISCSQSSRLSKWQGTRRKERRSLSLQRTMRRVSTSRSSTRTERPRLTRAAKVSLSGSYRDTRLSLLTP